MRRIVLAAALIPAACSPAPDPPAPPAAAKPADVPDRLAEGQQVILKSPQPVVEPPEGNPTPLPPDALVLEAGTRAVVLSDAGAGDARRVVVMPTDHRLSAYRFDVPRSALTPLK